MLVTLVRSFLTLILEENHSLIYALNSTGTGHADMTK